MTTKNTYPAPDVDLNFEAIDEHIEGAGLDALLAQAAVETPLNKTDKLLASYTAVRPILAALSVLPLLPAQWRMGLRIFVGALDAFALPVGDAAVDDFKAGNDL